MRRIALAAALLVSLGTPVLAYRHHSGLFPDVEWWHGLLVGAVALIVWAITEFKR